jgi:hypothetical protein
LDIELVIQELRARREKISRMIEMLEKLEVTEASPRPEQRRGRKSMGTMERRKVSERMKRYWEDRKTAERRAAIRDSGALEASEG